MLRVSIGIPPCMLNGLVYAVIPDKKQPEILLDLKKKSQNTCIPEKWLKYLYSRKRPEYRYTVNRTNSPEYRSEKQPRIPVHQEINPYTVYTVGHLRCRPVKDQVAQYVSMELMHTKFI